jgi:Na+-translocating ferredoxin:NAD+ oxidoreductase RnfD subunit
MVRAVAVALLGAIAILAFYFFGRDVLIPAALAVHFAFILGPRIATLCRRAAYHALMEERQ